LSVGFGRPPNERRRGRLDHVREADLHATAQLACDARALGGPALDHELVRAAHRARARLNGGQ